ncbi:hypothetical protein LINPERHAP2_LOCUS23267, partial [Linum perenne]
FYKPWFKALVVRVLERSFSFGAVKRRLESCGQRTGIYRCLMFPTPSSLFALLMRMTTNGQPLAGRGKSLTIISRNYIGRLSGLTWRLQKVLEPGMRGCVSRLMCLNRSLVNI